MGSDDGYINDVAKNLSDGVVCCETSLHEIGVRRDGITVLGSCLLGGQMR